MTTRNHALLFACLMAAGSGCAPNSGPIYISRFLPMPDDCNFGTAAVAGVFKSGGSLDVAPGAPQYFVALELAGGANVQSTAVTGGGQTIEPANRNRAIINEFVITYTSTPKVTNLPTKEYHLATSVRFDSTTNIADMGINLLSPEASQALDGIETGKSYRLIVTINGIGSMSGSGGRFTTGETTFPITVYKGEYPKCKTLQVLTSACNYNGQDRGGAPPACCDGVTPTPMTCPPPP